MKRPRLSIYHRILAMALSIILLLSFAIGLIVWDSLDDILSQQLQKRGAEIATHAPLEIGACVAVERFAGTEAFHQFLHRSGAVHGALRAALIAAGRACVGLLLALDLLACCRACASRRSRAAIVSAW